MTKLPTEIRKTIRNATTIPQRTEIVIHDHPDAEQARFAVMYMTRLGSSRVTTKLDGSWFWIENNGLHPIGLTRDGAIMLASALVDLIEKTYDG